MRQNAGEFHLHSALLLSKSHHVVHKKVTAADRMMAKGQALVKTGLFCIKLSDVMFFFFPGLDLHMQKTVSPCTTRGN